MSENGFATASSSSENTRLLYHSRQPSQQSYTSFKSYSSFGARTPNSQNTPGSPRSCDTAGAPPPNGADAHGITRPRAITIIVALGMLIFLQAANMSLLTTTQSSIAASLDAFEQAPWFTSAYLVTASSLAPLLGRLSHVFSPRNCIFVATIVFSVGGLVTALASSLASFLLGRALTGVGAAGIFTVSIILVVQLTSLEQRGLFMGLVNSGFTVGVSLGAVLAGALEPAIGWRPLFYLQTPISFAAGIALFLGIPKSFSADNSSSDTSLLKRILQLDYVGAALLTSGIMSLLLGFSLPHVAVLPIVISFIILPLFVIQEAHNAKEPVVPVTVLKSRGALLSCFATLGFMMARWSILFYTPTYAIAVQGWHPASAGSMLIPTNAGFALGGLVAGWLHIRRAGSFWLPCVIVFTLFPMTLLALSQATASPPLFILLLFCNGLVTGAALNYTLAHILHLVLPETRFIVTSLLATFRGFAGTFGSAIGGGLFTRSLKSSLRRGFEHAGLPLNPRRDELIRRLLGSPALVNELEGTEKRVAVNGYTTAIRSLFVAAAALSALMIFVQAGTGWEEPTKVDASEQSAAERRHLVGGEAESY